MQDAHATPNLERPYQVAVRRLTETRVSAGLSATQAAAKIGVSVSTLLRWESLASVAPADAFLAWCDALKVLVALSYPPAPDAPLLVAEPSSGWRVPRRPRGGSDEPV